jgi:hypothetical protein
MNQTKEAWNNAIDRCIEQIEKYEYHFTGDDEHTYNDIINDLKKLKHD